jgi:hypothetical protein
MKKNFGKKVRSHLASPETSSFFPSIVLGSMQHGKGKKEIEESLEWAVMDFRRNQTAAKHVFFLLF